MKDKVKNALLVFSAGAALALGGAAIAGAADDVAASGEAATGGSRTAPAGTPGDRR